VPGLPLTLASEGGSWSLNREDVPNHPVAFLTNGFFYTSQIKISYAVGGRVVGMCVKDSPQPLVSGNAGTLELEGGE
jgi:hypothetical protein